MKTFLRPAMVLIAYLATVIINTLAVTLPLNGQETGKISDSFPVYFVPAGYVFSIWGVIYVATGAYAIYQFLRPQRENDGFDKIGWLFVLSSIANCVWIFLWHYLQFTMTLPIMLVLLGTLIAMYVLIGRKPKLTTGKNYWLVRLPFSIYLGWVTVATIANVTVWLYNLGITNLFISGSMWSSILVLVAMALAILFIVRKRDYAYAAVIVWAVGGILVKFRNYPDIKIASIVAIVSIVVCMTLSALSHKRILGSVEGKSGIL